MSMNDADYRFTRIFGPVDHSVDTFTVFRQTALSF